MINLKIGILLGLTLAAYLIWALQHHHRDRSLTWEIMVEYLLIAALSVIILFNFNL